MTVFDRIWNWFKGLVGEVEPALEAWFKKFMSDEGKLILATALAEATAVATGAKTIQQAGADLISVLATQGLQVAETDALDAIRTQLSYIQAQPAA